MTVLLENAGSLWLIGCGNMGGAMLRGWLADGLPPANVTIVDPVLENAPQGVRLVREIPAGEAPSILVIAIKPQSLDAAAPALRQGVQPQTLVISILAGVETTTLKARLGADAVVRAMPNTPAAIGQGVTALFSSDASASQRKVSQALMKSLGTVAWIDDEAQFDAVTALSGCGPGFVFRFIDALADAGAALGLDPALAAILARDTVAGAAALARASNETPAVLADRVASPGGATREGLNRLDQADGIRHLLNETLDAAAQRSRAMAEAARQA